MSRILVIGSKGFIGKHCVEHFSVENDVWGCDVVVDYNTESYFLVDAASPNYSEIFLQEQFDVCINCSGAASVPDSYEHPLRDFTLNTFNVFEQLDAIRRFNPTCKYVNLSSAAVYGNPETLPIREDSVLNPISPYGRHKKMAEQICREFAVNFNLATVSMRVFSAYGPGLTKQLFWDLYKKAVGNNAVELFGTGKESRDYIYIKDLVRLIGTVISCAKFKGEAMNAASGEETTIAHAAELFYGLFDHSIDVRFTGRGRAGDPVNWQADVSLIKDFGFQPTYSLSDGLKEFYTWVRESV